MKRLIEEIRSLTPTVDTHYRIGMRVIKTAVSVCLCLFFAFMMGTMESVLIAAVAAIVTVRATQEETVTTGAFRLIGTIIGGALGSITVLISFYLPFYNEGLFVLVIPIMLLLNLYLCNVLNMQDSCVISCVVTIIVAVNVAPLGDHIGEALMFALMRVRDTFIGVTIATIMNIVPYRISERIKKRKESEGE